MRPGRAARSCIRVVERYRRWGAARGSGCRFHPSCSTYALEALRTHPLPVALWMVGWRFLRCNPLVSLGTRDPIGRRPRFRARPNGLATTSTLLAGTGLLVIGLTTIAFAQGVTGGCTATVNGTDPSTMTRSDPLVVGEGHQHGALGSDRHRELGGRVEVGPERDHLMPPARRGHAPQAQAQPRER